MKLKQALVLGLAVFLLALVIAFPARWIAGAIPEGLACAQWSGSIWNGQCRDLTVTDQDKVLMKLSSLRWKLKPLALLRLSLSAQFQSHWPQGEAAGDVSVASGGMIRLRAMSGASRLDRQFFGAIPQGWSGQVQIRQLDFDWQAGQLGRLGGELEVSNLADARGNALGGYRLELQPGETAPFQGLLRDTGGPIEVDAQLLIAEDGSWSLVGRMRARDPGDARLNRQLDVLSNADVTGWRRLSLEGDFR